MFCNYLNPRWWMKGWKLDWFHSITERWFWLSIQTGLLTPNIDYRCNGLVSRLWWRNIFFILHMFRVFEKTLHFRFTFSFWSPHPHVSNQLQKSGGFPSLFLPVQCSSMICTAKNTLVSRINCTIVIWFFECFGIPESPVSFNAGSSNLKGSMFGVHAGTVVSTRAIVAVLLEKMLHGTSGQVTPGFSVNEDLVLRELGREEVQKVSHVSLSVYKYSERDLLILYPFLLASQRRGWFQSAF